MTIHSFLSTFFILLFLLSNSLSFAVETNKKTKTVNEAFSVEPAKRSLRNPKRDIKTDKYRQSLPHQKTITEETSQTSDKKDETENESTPFFNWEAVYKMHYFRNVHGGKKVEDAEIHNIDLKGELNFDQFPLLKGYKGFVNVMNNAGNIFSEHVGDTQITSNIEAPKMLFVYQAWIEKLFLENTVSLLIGLMEMNTDFYVTDSSVLFLNSSFGVGTEFASSGLRGPSTYPYTSVGARAKIDFPNKLYALWGVFDGVPGNAQKDKSNSINWESSEGLLMITEIGSTSQANEISNDDVFSKFGVGIWGYTNSFDNIDPNSDKNPEGNYGIYILYDKTVSPRFSYFFRSGYANREVSSTMLNTSFGLNWRAPFKTIREEDILGFAVTDIIFSPGYKNDQALQEGVDFESHEIATELTYRINIFKDAALQPDYQIVFNPSGNSTISTAHIFALQLEIQI